MTGTLAGFTVGDRVRVVRAKFDRWPVGSIGYVKSVSPAHLGRGFWDGIDEKTGRHTGGIFEREFPDSVGVRFDVTRPAQWGFAPEDLEHFPKREGKNA